MLASRHRDTHQLENATTLSLTWASLRILRWLQLYQALNRQAPAHNIGAALLASSECANGERMVDGRHPTWLLRKLLSNKEQIESKRVPMKKPAEAGS